MDVKILNSYIERHTGDGQTFMSVFLFSHMMLQYSRDHFIRKVIILVSY